MRLLHYLAIIYILTGMPALSQEIAVPLNENPVIKQYIHTHGFSAARVSGAGDTLHLPFIDDFSSTVIYPSVLRWDDNFVFINSDFPRNMPTVGAATFDGLNEMGNAYAPGSTFPGQADVLTSKPLYLFTKPGGGNYVPADSIYISFYYEKKGFGDAPDVADSLILECYKPGSATWTREWFATGGVTGGQDTLFTRVDVLLSSADYYADGFRFRFRNYGNLSGALDHWHIDYVRVFTPIATSFNFIDQAFADDRSPLINGFTSVPWQHYKAAASQNDLIVDSSTFRFIIHHSSPNENAGFAHQSYSYDGDLVGSFTIGTNVYPANQFLRLTYPVNYILPVTEEFSPDSTYFDITDHFSFQLSADAVTSNDTIRFRQHLYNYYSYDDGTCEVGYDLVNAPGGKVAMKFNALQNDFIYGMQIYFARQNADVSSKLITLKVWSSLNPESTVLQIFNKTPDYVDSINGFATYYFGTPVSVGTEYYLGFQQVDADGLHLGFDRNTTNNSRMYYNVSGSWSFVSVLPGTFMIRPLIGNITVDVEEVGNTGTFGLYPNPVTDYIYLSGTAEENASYIITDMGGRQMMTTQAGSNVIDVSTLANGAYLISKYSEENISTPQRFVINR